MRRQLIISLISIGGIFFSGFLTFYNSIGACPLIEGCSYLLGLPSCLYGLVIFASLLLLAIIDKNLKFTRLVSLAGVGFAVVTTVIDLFVNPSQSGYSLGLPSCVYGLIMYIMIFVLTLKPTKTPNK